MKIAIHRYELNGASRLNAKSTSRRHAGALFKVAFLDGCTGYADCHPWPELGDLPLDIHLRLLHQGHLTRLSARALAFAREDALKRKKGVSSFEGVKIPPSQILFVDLAGITDAYIDEYIAQGYPVMKVKGELKLIAALKALLASIQKKPLKLRLDFNCSLNPPEFEHVLNELSPYLDAIDFFEDPTPFHLGIWQSFKRRYGIKLACDREVLKAYGFPESADVLIVKPALYDLEDFCDCPQEVVVTSYMDHPLGQAAAAWAASKFSGRLGVCGFLTQYAYAPTPFSEALRHQGPWLNPPQGCGFGFDALLEKLHWEEWMR
jgi:O-succinylbenzoate synthase